MISLIQKKSKYWRAFIESLSRVLFVILVLLQFHCPFTSKREACVERNDRNELDYDAETCLILSILIDNQKKRAESYLAAGDINKYDSAILIISLEQAYYGNQCIMSSIAAAKCKKESNIQPNW